MTIWTPTCAGMWSGPAVHLASRLPGLHLCVSMLLAALLVGCSMHPLPEDVSRVSTYDIVKRIRCEVKEALDTFKNDPRADRIIKLTAIGYDFNFNMTEGNHIRDDGKPGAALTVRRPSFKDASKGFTLNVTGRAERTRQNVRRFRIVEELSELTGRYMDCTDATKRENWAHPITGATGLGEIVATYVSLELMTDFRNPQFKPPQATGTGVPGKPFTFERKNVVFSDVLTFTTSLSAGAKPTLTLASIRGDVRLTSSSLFGQAERNDIHALIVAIASDPGTVDRPLDPDAASAPGRAMARAAARSVASSRQRAALVTDGAVGDERTVTALVQKDADARNRVLIELERLRSLLDEEREAPTLLGKRILKIMREPAEP